MQKARMQHHDTSNPIRVWQSEVSEAQVWDFKPSIGSKHIWVIPASKALDYAQTHMHCFIIWCLILLSMLMMSNLCSAETSAGAWSSSFMSTIKQQLHLVLPIGKKGEDNPQCAGMLASLRPASQAYLSEGSCIACRVWLSKVPFTIKLRRTRFQDFYLTNLGNVKSGLASISIKLNRTTNIY